MLSLHSYFSDCLYRKLVNNIAVLNIKVLWGIIYFNRLLCGYFIVYFMWFYFVLLCINIVSYVFIYLFIYFMFCLFYEQVVSFTAGETDCSSSSCEVVPSRCQGCLYNGKLYNYEQKFTNGRCNECICTRTGSVQCTCSKLTKRKEIRDMTSQEVAAYQLAIRKVC